MTKTKPTTTRIKKKMRYFIFWAFIQVFIWFFLRHFTTDTISRITTTTITTATSDSSSSSSTLPLKSKNDTNKSNARHHHMDYPNKYFALEHVPLFDWERASVGMNTTTTTFTNNTSSPKCQPPKDMPEYCCLGSVSSGTEILYRPGICQQRTSVYRRVEQQALEFLQQHPIVRSFRHSPNSQTNNNNNNNNTPQQDNDDDHDSTSSSYYACDVCQMMDVLLQYNWTLAFQGDSVTRQSFQALDCELRRRGFIVDSEISTWRKRDGLPWNYGHTDTSVLTVTWPLSSNNDDKSNSSNTRHHVTRTTRIYYYGMYRPLPDMLEVRNLVFRNSDIVVFDHGLHFQPTTEGKLFTELMSSMMKTIRLDSNNGGEGSNTSFSSNDSSSRVKLLAWRETSAQHFNTTGGHYQRRGMQGRGCFPVRTGREGPRWTWTAQAAYANGFTLRNVSDASTFFGDLWNGTNNLKNNDELVVIPFRQFTMDLEELHPGVELKGGDCSHYCYTPYLWLPIWRSLRLAMDRTNMRIQNQQQQQEQQQQR